MLLDYAARDTWFDEHTRPTAASTSSLSDGDTALASELCEESTLVSHENGEDGEDAEDGEVRPLQICQSRLGSPSEGAVELSS